MTISWVQAAILGLFACLSSMPGLGGTTIGNYTLGRPLVGGLICGLVLGDLKTGIMCGVAMQLVYIALVTPGGTVSADVRAVSYIGIPLAMVAVHSQGLSATCLRVQPTLPSQWELCRDGRNCSLLWNGYDESCVAAHGLEGSRAGQVQEITVAW